MSKKVSLTTLFTLVLTLVLVSVAFAADGSSLSKESALALGAGLGVAIAAFGGAIGQGMTASKAMEGIARNPAARSDVFIPMMLGLAFIESLVIYAFLIAIFLQGKIPGLE